MDKLIRLSGRRVVVVGAGIAGLAAGFRLQQMGCEVTVLERGSTPGGRMETIERDGYRIDTGASVLPRSYRQMLALIADAGLADQVEATSNVMAVLRDGVVHRLDGIGLRALVGTKLLGLRSKAALATALLDVARCWKDEHWYDLSGAQALDTESVGDFARRRLTPEIADYLIAPICNSLFLTPPDDVAKVALLFCLGAMAGQSFFSSREGVGFLTAGLARQLRVEYSATVEAVEEDRAGVRVHWTRPGEGAHDERACAAVIAVPATQVPGLFDQVTPDQAALLSTRIYSRSIVTSFGLARPPPDEPSVWLNVPRQAGIPDLTALILDHNKAPGRVPPGRGMITTYWMRDWSARRWDDDDDRLARDAVAAASKVLPKLGDQVEMTCVRRWDPCVSVRRPGGYKALRAFMAGLDPASRVQLAGDYFTSISSNGSLASGERAASRVADVLAGPATRFSFRRATGRLRRPRNPRHCIAVRQGLPGQEGAGRRAQRACRPAMAFAHQG